MGTEWYHKYQSDPAANTTVLFLENPQYAGSLIHQIPFSELNCILIKGNQYAMRYDESDATRQHTFDMIDLAFADLPVRHRIPSLIYLIAHIISYQLPLNPSETRKDLIVNAEWLLPILRIESLEPYLRNKDYARLIFEAIHELMDLYLDYELHSVEQDECLKQVFLKVRQVCSEAQDRAIAQTKLFKQELIETVMHPDRIEPLIEKYGIEVLEWGI